MRTIQQILVVMLGLLVLTQTTSCDKGEEDVLASFTSAADATNFYKINFTNASQNFSKVAWDFGDTGTSTETSPSHVYTALGEFTVKLTATSIDGKTTDVYTAKVTIADPDAELTKLTGTTSKTWKLLRDVSTGQFPLEVGPISRAEIWWAQGRQNDELANRPCILNDEYTFSRDKTFKYDTKGDFWAEGGVFDPSGACFASTAANLKGPNGLDLSAFGDGTHTFSMTLGANPTLTVTGLGAFIGLPKIGTDSEVKVPQSSVTLDIVKLTDGPVDTLIVESKYKQDPASTTDQAYWRIVLVHYDNPADEPEIPSPAPIAGFDMTTNGKTITLTNTSTAAATYEWSFGDGNTSTEASPTHTYSDNGVYVVTLKAINGSKNTTAVRDAIINPNTAPTLADIKGGAWRVRAEENSVVVGPGMGDPSWYRVPKADLAPGGSWACMTDDEFIFGDAGVYEYKTNGSARNDGYFGGANGCIDDATIAASGNGAAFGSGTHSYTFTDAAGGSRAIIELTNGANRAAFIGFYKGYYGGENGDPTKAANGGASTNRYEVMYYVKSATKEYLYVTVDISAGKDGSASWSTVLER